jgi:DNA-directed RNA polymerase subunit alpha
VFAVEAPLESRLGMLVSDLRLGTRAQNGLDEARITTVRELVARTRKEIAELRNLGEQTVEEIEAKLRENGLHLGMEIPAHAEA